MLNFPYLKQRNATPTLYDIHYDRYSLCLFIGIEYWTFQPQSAFFYMTCQLWNRKYSWAIRSSSKHKVFQLHVKLYFRETLLTRFYFFKIAFLIFHLYVLIIYLNSSHLRATYYAFNCKSDLLWNWPTYSIFCPIIFRLYLSSFLSLTLYPISLMCVWVCTVRERNQRHGTTLFVAVFNKNLFCKSMKYVRMFSLAFTLLFSDKHKIIHTF